MKYLTTPLLSIACIVLAFLLLRTCGEPEPAIPPELQARADSLASTKAERDAARDSLARSADSNQALASALRRRSVPARVAAVAAGVTADSAAGLAALAATARDSAVAWEAAYRARGRQADSLQSVVSTLDAAAVKDSIATAALRAGWAADSTRLLVAEGLVRDLVEAAEKKHRWAWMQRLGVHAGYGVVATIDGQLKHGLTVSAGVKLWP